ncbi:hypothetical protein OU792_11205, partial [Algoriphagus sp. NF]|uniref:hypothetical protein n=1 Tax=Algoriphagus sp. NF TaxID=2992756 RepID=UPI00237B01C8
MIKIFRNIIQSSLLGCFLIGLLDNFLYIKRKKSLFYSNPKQFSQFVGQFLLIFGLLVIGGVGEVRGQISHRNSQTATNLGNTLSIPRPVGLEIGDVMIVNIMQSEDSGSAFVPELNVGITSPGWSPVNERIIQSVSSFNSNAEWGASVLFKVADASDVAALSFLFTGDPDTELMVGGITSFDGVDFTGGYTASGIIPGGPFDAPPGVINVGVGEPLQATSINTTSADSYVVMLSMVAAQRTFGNGAGGW